MKSSLLSNQKEQLPSKSRNPIAQQSLSQKQGAAILKSLPNNFNPMSQTTDLGMGGQSAMTLLFNQQQMTSKSKEGLQKSMN